MSHFQLAWANIENIIDSGELRLSFPLTIGRSRNNDLVLESIDGGVSRQHARITLGQQGVILTDLGSTNGTYINGRLVNEALLEEGSRICIGNYLLILTSLIRCPDDNCQRLVRHQHLTCPWCGHFLADAVTQVELLQH